MKTMVTVFSVIMTVISTLTTLLLYMLISHSIMTGTAPIANKAKHGGELAVGLVYDVVVDCHRYFFIHK